MSSMDEGYVMLAEAIVGIARKDYAFTSGYLMSNPRVMSKNKHHFKHLVVRYITAREFFRNSCNGMVGEPGDILLHSLDLQYKVDHDMIMDFVWETFDKFKLKLKWEDFFIDAE